MKNPIMAPSNERMRLTLMASTPTRVATTRKKSVKSLKNFSLRWGLFRSVVAYFLVKKNKIGRTE